MLRSSPNFMLIDNTQSRLIAVFQLQASMSRLKRSDEPRGGWEKSKADEKEGIFLGRGEGTLLAPNNDRKACRKVSKTSLKRYQNVSFCGVVQIH